MTYDLRVEAGMRLKLGQHTEGTAVSRRTTSQWQSKRTDETREVARVLRKAGFEQVDVYRYHSASIRVRVIDSSFEGLGRVKRDSKVEKILKTLPPRTQGDIVMLLTFAPSGLEDPRKDLRENFMNLEFEDPSPSTL